MIGILVISRYAAPPYPAAPDFLRKRWKGGDASHQRGKTPKWYMKYMTLCFSSPYFSFPLEGNASKRQRVYKAERRFDTPSLS